MNVEHIPAEDVDMLPCGADWQSRHLESEKRKAEIRDRIHKQAEQGQKTAKDYFRPAKPTPSIYDSDLKRVAVYARVSTSSEEQISSIENQTLYYTKKIAETENWNLQDIYSDEGKSGTSLRKRDAFKRMMRDAKDQKMDLIICASISRFARNFSDCMTQIAALKTMHPAHPIGVYFETENIYTLNPSSQYSLDIQALLADWESGNKSRRMILSYDQRIMTGQYPVADLMGYRHTKDGQLVIEPEEAKTVRFIFLAFIYGYNCDQIAAVLTQKKRSTLRGKAIWGRSKRLLMMCNSLLKDISKTIPVIIATHNNTIGVSVHPDYIVYACKEVLSDGKLEYHLYSGYPSSEDLVDLKGNHIPRKSVLLDCLEAGEAAYMDRRNSYEILNG